MTLVLEGGPDLARPEAAREHRAALFSGRCHEVDLRADGPECSLQRAERPQGRGHLGRHGEVVPDDEGEQRLEHAGGPAATRTGEPLQKLAQLALERPVVQVVGPVEKVEDGVGRGDRVTSLDGAQEQGQRVARTGVEPADGPEVEEREPPGLVDEDVALVQVGVEHPGDQHLPQYGPQQPVGHLLPQGRVHRRQQWGGPGDRRPGHPLHDDEPRGAELPVGVWDDDSVARVEAGGDGGVVGELDRVVELLVEAGREPLGE